jgi:hypothetical protein
MSRTAQLHTEVVYELCVPSFKDSNSDGLGDLPGIEEKLDYLKWLGVTATWLSPFYKTAFFQNVTGISGEILVPAANFLTTGRINTKKAPGHGTRQLSSSILIPSTIIKSI